MSDCIHMWVYCNGYKYCELCHKTGKEEELEQKVAELEKDSMRYNHIIAMLIGDIRRYRQHRVMPTEVESMLDSFLYILKGETER